MIALSALRYGTAVLALLVAAPPVSAQFVQAPTPTADALAAQMRLLGSNPRDVYALIAAGELSTKLGDPAAALGFFGRAQAVDPSNLRVVAGRAGALVLLERPGEALRLYDQAERGGVAMTPYLAQRGLAYDLVGQSGHAQRDYRRALLTDRDDETVRRLALSLGISGRRDEAMALLDPLLRRSDRGAWRARAFVLALSGDVVGAQKIAASMMAGGAALSPFLGRLQGLSPADRAFAVHFGQLTATAARANDARLAPMLAALTADPRALSGPVALAAADTRLRDSTSRDVRRRSNRGMAPAVTPRPTAVRIEPDSPPAQQIAARPTLSTGSVARAEPPIVRGTAPPVVQSSIVATPTPPLGTGVATPSVPAQLLPRQVERPPVEIVTLPRAGPVEITTVSPPPPPPPPPPAAAPASSPAVPTSLAVSQDTASPAITVAPATVPPAAAVASTASTGLVTVVPPPSAPVVVSPSAVPAPTAETSAAPVARRSGDGLSAIIETIAVPAAELDVAPIPRTIPQPRREPAPAKKPETVKPDPVKAEAKKPVPPKPDAKKPDAKKPEAKKPDPAKADPARWWVQVAGGARLADLDRDWRRLAAKSPSAFRGKSAWTTPLRATNRLLAGPFKSQAEAGAFVNLLAKDGSAAFAWQSPAGQKIERLDAE